MEFIEFSHVLKALSACAFLSAAVNKKGFQALKPIIENFNFQNLSIHFR